MTGPRLFCWLLLILPGTAVPAPPPLTPGAAPEPLTLEAAVAAATAGNPGLAALRARAAAMAAVPSQAGSLPDPVLSLGAVNLPVDTFDRAQEPMTQLQLGIEQKLPFPGKLEQSRRAAEFDAGAAASSADEVRLDLVRKVKTTWWQLFYLDRALEIVSRNQDLLRQFVQIAQTRYQVGEGLQQEVLLAQVELSKLIDRKLDLQGSHREQVARLDALLDRPATAPVRLPDKVDETLAALLPPETLMQRAENSRPLLAQRRQQIEAARARHDLARRDHYPDFTLGAVYGFRSGHNADSSSRPDMASVRLGISLPLYAGRKQDKAVEQRASELQQRQFALQDALRQVQADIVAASASYRRASEQVQLFKTGIIPQARQSVASMLSGYQVNKVDFLNLVRAQITLYDYENRYWKTFGEAHQALARLTADVGEEVTR
jgi:cobalt-zinc-cadmium efflux system outer membrane protein